MISFLHNALTNGLRLKGGPDNLGFVFFYELLTGSLNCKILSTDSLYNLGFFLVRIMPFEETSGNNPQIIVSQSLNKWD